MCLLGCTSVSAGQGSRELVDSVGSREMWVLVAIYPVAIFHLSVRRATQMSMDPCPHCTGRCCVVQTPTESCVPTRHSVCVHGQLLLMNRLTFEVCNRPPEVLQPLNSCLDSLVERLQWCEMASCYTTCGCVEQYAIKWLIMQLCCWRAHPMTDE
ncbi:unnamed protein product [Ectocarpus sp. 12 AP-2014]